MPVWREYNHLEILQICLYGPWNTVVCVSDSWSQNPLWKGVTEWAKEMTPLDILHWFKKCVYNCIAWVSASAANPHWSMNIFWNCIFLILPYEINGGQRKIHEILESFSQQFQSTWMFILFMHTKSLFESMFKRLTLAWTQCLSLNAKNRWHTPSLEKLTWATRLTMMSTLCNSNSETWSIPWTGYPAIFLSFTFQLRDHFVFYGTADNLL